MLKRFKFVSLDFVGAQHRCAPSRHNPNQTSFRAESAERGIPLHPTFLIAPTGAPHAGFARGSWVCLFYFCHPDRSGPIFSLAPNCGASGRAVEGSWQGLMIHPAPSFRTNHHKRQLSFRAKRGISLLLAFSVAGCPTRRFCVWVVGLQFLLLSSRPEQRRLMPLRSGGIMATPNRSPSPVIPNQPSQKTMVIPSEARCGFPSHAFCAMNLLFLLSSRVDHMPSRSPLSCRVPHTPVLRVGLGFASSCFVIPTGATAPYAVAEWRDRGNT